MTAYSISMIVIDDLSANVEEPGRIMPGRVSMAATSVRPYRAKWKMIQRYHEHIQN